MDLEIWQATSMTGLDLAEGKTVLGGAGTDGVRIEGLPPSLLELSLEGSRLTVRARQTVSIGDVLFPPGVPRLLMAGESIRLSGEVRLRRPPEAREAEAREQAGTAQVLRQLLSETPVPGETKAATLVCLTGLDVGRVYALATDTAEIGRGSGVEVRVRDRAVSRRHARVLRRPGGYVLEDLGGPNGVFLDGQPVNRRAALSDGAVIELGHSLLRFSGPAMPKPTPPDEPAGAEAKAPPEPPRGTAASPVPQSAPETANAQTAMVTPPPATGPAAASASAKSSATRLEWALIAAGATLAITGLLVSWGLG